MKYTLQLVLFLVFGLSNAWAQPTITGTNPSKHGNTANAGFSITFSEAMNASSINTTNILVHGSFRGLYSGSFSQSTNTFTFTPDSTIFPNEVITVTVTIGVQNASNIAMSESFVFNYRKRTTASDGGWAAARTETVHSGFYTDEVAIADFDNNGSLDIVALTPNQDKITIYLNDGNGGFGSGTVKTALFGPFDVDAADLDNDGDVDILVAVAGANNSSSLQIYKNNGNGTFADAVNYATPGQRTAREHVAVDMNGDGFLDIVQSNTNDDSLYVFLNSGTGTFSSVTGFGATGHMGALAFADVDSDNDMDIVTTDGTNNVIRFYQNNGNGVLSAGAGYNVGTTPVDLEFAGFSGSGPDVMVVNQGSDNTTTWYSPSGIEFGSFNTQSVGDEPATIAIGDLDNDNDLDAVVGNNVSQTLSFQIETTSSASSDVAHSESYTYSLAPTYANDVKLADMDGDGDLDIVTANQDGTFSVIENYEGGLVTASTPSNGSLDVAVDSDITFTFDESVNSATITSSTVSVTGSISGLIAGAFSYDGGSNTATFNPTSDFVAGETITLMVTDGVENTVGTPLAAGFTSSFKVATDNTAGAFASKVDYTSGDQAQAIIQADLNADGYPDIIVANYNASNIEVFLNDGDGTFGTGTTYASGSNPVGLAAGDVNGDGDIDIVSIANETIIAIFIGNGDGTLNAKATLTTTYNNALPAPTNVALVDIDLDGDLDLLYTTSGQLKSQENEGSGTFNNSSEWGYDSTTSKALSADMDADGDLDLVYVGSSNIVITRFINNNPSSVTTSSANQPIDVVIGDFDGDGDIDAVTANTNFGSGSISFYANSGSATFAAKVNYSMGASTVPKSITAADYDGDGDLDIFVTSYSNDEVVLFTNNGSAVFTLADSFTTGDGPFGLVVSDFDRDGNVDIATANENSDNISVLIAELPLELFSVSPIANSVGTTGLSSNLDFAFNQPINDATFTSADLTIWGSLTGEVAGALSYNAGSYTMTFNPTSDFKPGETISVLLALDVTATTGVTLTSSELYNFKVSATADDFFSMPLASSRIDYQTTQVTGVPVAADMDGDGDVDMVYSFYYSSNDKSVVAIIANDGSGNLTLLDSLEVGVYSSEVVVSDFDGDGDLDVAVSTFDYMVANESFVAVAFNDGSGNLFGLTNYALGGTDEFKALSVSDLNNDGYADIVGLDKGSGNMFILLNDQDGTFTKQSAITTGLSADGFYYGSAFADLNGDGYLDIVTSTYPDMGGGGGGEEFSAYGDKESMGAKKMAAYRALKNPAPSITAGDFMSVFINNGNGSFAAAVGYNITSNGVYGVTTGDIDSDGDIDVIATGDGQLMIFSNNGSGNLGSSTNTSLTSELY